MAVEQLKYDFELNLSKAERQLDQFVNKAEQKLNRVSDGLEKKMATATKGGSRGDGTADLERRLRTEDRIIERYELNRIRRREQIKAKEMAADLRADQLQKKAVSRFGDDPVLLDKALSARKRYEAERAQIIREGSLKNSAILQAELKRAEAGYKAELEGLGPKGKKGGRSGRYGMLNSLAFGAQQMVEDYNYAGFRGLSNNLAFMGAIIGGPAGLAIIAGVAAKNLYDLGKSLLSTGDAAAQADAQNQRYLSTIKEIAELRQQRADQEADFESPRSMREFEKRQAALERQRERLAKRPGAETNEVELSKLRRLAHFGAEITAGLAVATGEASSPEAWKRVDEARARYEAIRKSLERPDSVPHGRGFATDFSVLDERIKKMQEELDLALQAERSDRDRLATEERLLNKAREFAEQLEKQATASDRITSKLQEQVSAEEQLVETSKRRMEALSDSRYSLRDKVGDTALDFQSKHLEKTLDRQINRMVEFDKRRNELLFKQSGGDTVPGLRNRFEQWQEHRSNLIKAEGEKASYNAQAKLAQVRAQELRARAQQELEKARGFAGQGNMVQADRMFERSIGSLEKVMELQERFMNMDGNPARSKAFFVEFQQFAKAIDDIMAEQSKAHENFGKQHADTLAKMHQMELELVDINKAAEALQFVDDGDLARVKEMNTRLEEMVKFLKEAKAAQPDRKGEMPGGGGGLFSIPFEGEFPGAGKANLPSRVERGAKRIAEIQQSVQRKVAAQEKVRQDTATKAHQRREEAHQRRLATMKRLEDRKGGGLAVPPKAGMKGVWGDFGPLGRDPLARAQGYWPMVDQMIRKQENDLRQVGGGRWNASRKYNEAMRTGPLQDLREQAHGLKRELDEGVTARRAKQIGDEFQRILKDATAIDPARPARQNGMPAQEPIWRRRDRDGNWTEGKGLLAPEGFGAGVNTTSSLNFRGPVPGPGVVNNVSNTVMNAHTVINTVQAPDANKLARDMAAKAKASKARKSL